MSTEPDNEKSLIYVNSKNSTKAEASLLLVPEG
jgi:hypothetical protein